MVALYILGDINSVNTMQTSVNSNKASVNKTPKSVFN